MRKIIRRMPAVAGILLGLSAQAQLSPAAPTVKKPNIIFILTDDLGFGDIGVFFQQQRQRQHDKSEPWQLSPHIDSMAAGGAILTQSYCNAPVCAPSRASLLSGVHQGHAQVRDNQFDKALEANYNIANVLQSTGYTTAVIGKWGLQGDGEGPDWPAHPLNRGFDYFYGYMRHADGHEHYPKEGKYRGAKQVWENRTEVAAGLDKCYTGDLWTAAAKNWIIRQQQQPAAKPFMLYLAYDLPHAVLELPAQAYPAGGGLTGGVQWEGKPGRMINTAGGTIDSWVHPDYATATWDHDKNPATPEVPWPDTYKRYATINRRLDDAVGDLLQLLKDLHIGDNTLVVFTSDNGPSIESYLPAGYAPNSPEFFKSFGPFDGIKRDCWEGGVRMPVVVSWPGHIAVGKTISTPNNFSDWLPTFLAAAGTPPPVRTDGVSLLPALTGHGTQQASNIYVEYAFEGRSPGFSSLEPARRNRVRNQMQLLRIGDHVGVRYDIKTAADDFEIYDIVKDPKETTNLAANGGMAALQAQLKAKVLQGRMPDSTAPRPYDTAGVPAVAVSHPVKGVRWKTYAGQYPWIPATGALTPALTGHASRMAKEQLHAKQTLCYEGYLHIPADGRYTFYVQAAAGAFLRIHDAAVIDADYGYTPGTVKQGAMHLKKGLHPFRLYYKQTTARKPVSSLQWSGPGIPRQDIPATVFYQEP
ncbi:sulfatase-like hydrolase/transferase [Chitinophaga nivalis]|uniref:Sulfatase-like hydrolase/transferase n=1 Tax=Chitinophaga nivalis TaxID=2991709 RepID=A0ABT3IH35_9BACT|nr:sulfatase-like hydrolase/transferase [Chitinophaga nivalis]MCW3467193.1 sulfatase-like hydrolase/transferase [Chitinophaga nivalis]MCW3483115.1 sulfatase-like hydrolase/transferase [Chitinophaga nivalis]